MNKSMNKTMSKSTKTMNKSTRSVLMSTAVGSLLALGSLTLAGTASAADEAAKEKCFGVAAAGQNDCAGNGHGCQGQAKNDKDPNEWKYVPAGQCAQQGGATTAPKKEG